VKLCILIHDSLHTTVSLKQKEGTDFRISNTVLVAQMKGTKPKTYDSNSFAAARNLLPRTIEVATWCYWHRVSSPTESDHRNTADTGTLQITVFSVVHTENSAATVGRPMAIRSLLNFAKPLGMILSHFPISCGVDRVLHQTHTNSLCVVP